MTALSTQNLNAPESDAATRAHPAHYPALAEWDRYRILRAEDHEARLQYCRAELARVEREGVSPVYLAITLPLEEQQNDCLSVLAESGRTFCLRLVAGAVPPSSDAQGRLLPPEKRGKILAAKVGTRRFGDAASQRYARSNINAHRHIDANQRRAARDGDVHRHPDARARSAAETCCPDR